MSKRTRSTRRRAGRIEQSSRNSRVPHKESLAAMLDWFLSGEDIFSKVKFHGNTSWLPRSLVWLAIFWA